MQRVKMIFDYSVFMGTIDGIIALEGGENMHSEWPASVEVDIVALGGHLWIEVKDTERFGIGSSRWLGSSGRSAGAPSQ